MEILVLVVWYIVHNENNNGPIIEPKGTPFLIFSGSNLSLAKSTVCNLFTKKFEISSVLLLLKLGASVFGRGTTKPEILITMIV